MCAYKNEGTGNSAVDSQAEKIWALLSASLPAVAKEKFAFPAQSGKDADACKAAMEALHSLAQRAGPPNEALAPVDSEFVNLLIPDLKKKLAAVESKNASITFFVNSQMRLTSKDITDPTFINDFQWHTGPDFLDTDHLMYKEDQFAAVVAGKGKAATDREEKRRLKLLQRGEATKKKFIDSFLVDSPVKRKLIADLESG